MQPVYAGSLWIRNLESHTMPKDAKGSKQKGSKPRYTEEFKREVVEFACREGVSIGQASRKYGPSKPTIRKWLKEFGGSWRQGEPENPIERNSKGHFKKGVSGNPSGNTSAVEQAKRAAQDASLEAIQTLLKVMRTSTDRYFESEEGLGGGLALQSIREVLDRGIGKPAQVQHIVQSTKLSIEDFEDVRDLCDAKLKAFEEALEGEGGGGG